MPELPRYVSAQTILTQYLDIGRRTLERWLSDPRSGFPRPAIKRGARTRLWRRADIEQWLKGQEVQA